jgi:hypothetical protein
MGSKGETDGNSQGVRKIIKDCTSVHRERRRTYSEENDDDDQPSGVQRAEGDIEAYFAVKEDLERINEGEELSLHGCGGSVGRE